MANPLILKLDRAGVLDDADRAILEQISSNARKIEAHQDLIREGDRPENVLLVMEGFAYRYKIVEEGRRQIMAILVPGDFCDLHIAILGRMDHNIGTAGGCSVVAIPRATIDQLTSNHPRITRALWWATLTDEGTLREWLVNMGQREADKQMAHLFCELLVRLQVVECASRDTFALPISQADLADTLGITTVHVSRVVRELRDQGLVQWQSKRIFIPNVERLKDFAEFNPNYLHLIPRGTGSNDSGTRNGHLANAR